MYDLERIAALIWRFVGLFIVLSALPVAFVDFFVTLFSMAGGDAGNLGGSSLSVLYATLLIVAGSAVMNFSVNLGRMIARGL